MDPVQGYSFGTLITTAPTGEPVATHLPFAFFPERGEYGSFFSHIASDSPQVRRFAPLCTDAPLALITFLGPHSYISPRWYGAGQRATPTWNYMAVHVYGRPTVIDDPQEVRSMLGRAVAQYEAEMAVPWSLDSQSDDYLGERMELMTAFEVPVQRIATKARLGRKQQTELNQELADWLEVQPDMMRRELARLIRGAI